MNHSTIEKNERDLDWHAGIANLERSPYDAVLMTNTPTARLLADRALMRFSCMWACATLFHLAFRNNFLTSPWDAALSAAAVFVLWNPEKVWVLLLCAGVQLVELFDRLPQVSNHWLFTGTMNLTLLSCAAYAVMQRGTTKDSFGAALWKTFAPIARISLLILYFFVVLHKLNWDFLNPKLSCAVSLYDKIVARHPFLPNGTWLHELTIWGTIAAETAIPLLLVSARFRMLGVLSSLLLHFTFAILPQYFNFSSMMFAMLSLFVFDDAHRDECCPVTKPSGLLERCWRPLAALVTIVLAYWLLRHSSRGALLSTVHVTWILYALGASWYLLSRRPLLRASAVPAKELLRIRPRGFWIFPALLLFNGFCPYLGLKNETSFAMYSNLRTERKKFNHVFIPRWVQIFHYQDDIVEIKASSNRRLQKFIKRKWLINYQTLRLITSRQKKGWVAYVRKGELVKVPNIAKDPKLGKPANIWRRKFFHFKPLSKNGRSVCQH